MPKINETYKGVYSIGNDRSKDGIASICYCANLVQSKYTYQLGIESGLLSIRKVYRSTGKLMGYYHWWLLGDKETAIYRFFNESFCFDDFINDKPIKSYYEEESFRKTTTHHYTALRFESLQELEESFSSRDYYYGYYDVADGCGIDLEEHKFFVCSLYAYYRQTRLGIGFSQAQINTEKCLEYTGNNPVLTQAYGEKLNSLYDLKREGGQRLYGARLIFDKKDKSITIKRGFNKHMLNGCTGNMFKDILLRKQIPTSRYLVSVEGTPINALLNDAISRNIQTLINREHGGFTGVSKTLINCGLMNIFQQLYEYLDFDFLKSVEKYIDDTLLCHPIVKEALENITFVNNKGYMMNSSEYWELYIKDFVDDEEFLKNGSEPEKMSGTKKYVIKAFL